MNFFVIDVETANTNYSSICQIGLVKFENSEIVEKWSTYVNPMEDFDPFNVHIHGISERDVKNAPIFPEVSKFLDDKIGNSILIHHMPFDRIAFNQVCEKYAIPHFKFNWVDSAKIVRRTWEEFAYRGYGLSNIANFLNIEFQHHDALEDAVATGKIVIEAIKKSGFGINDLAEKVKRPINQQKYQNLVNQDGNPEGDLYGETIVFTGKLSLPRIEAAKLASKMGCNVNSSVTKRTTILVVGFQDEFKLAGYRKSSKHRKAEELIKKGQKIKLLSENDFLQMVNYSS